jgi:site-specific DNA-methyltransferase (adenine-specific)
MTETKERAGRNRTITLTKEEYDVFSNNLPNFKDRNQIELVEIISKTVNSDLFYIIDLLPKQFADLIVIDPPYNLTKDFNGFTFK